MLSQFNDATQLHMPHSVEWEQNHECWIMKQAITVYFKALSQNLTGTENPQKKTSSEYPLSGPEIELGTFSILRSAKQLTTDDNCTLH
jgi:hypothetical protein